MTRPGPNTSAFGHATCGPWLEHCAWPANANEALDAVSSLASRHAPSSFHESIAGRFVALQKRLQLPLGTSLPSTATVSPTGLNTHQSPPPRYFRALVWNLENFTNDRRPAGTKPLESARNQTRLAIVADCAHRLGADVLLVMETGSDVGQAMTALATRWGEKEKKAEGRSVEPLVSPATHAIPQLPIEVLAQAFGASVENVRALRLLGEGYRLSPSSFSALTNDGLRRAVELLAQTSNDVQRLAVHPQLAGTLEESILSLTRYCLEGLSQVDFASHGCSGEDVDFIGQLLDEAVSSPEQFLVSNEPPPNTMGPFGPLPPQPNRIPDLGRVRRALLATRELIASLPGPSYAVGVAEYIELTLLAWLHGRNVATANELSGQVSQVPIWVNGYGQPADLVVIIHLVATGQRLDVRAHDLDNGPMFSCSDGELLLGALMRLHVVPPVHAETYGIVYRPYTPHHLEAFLRSPGQSLGFSTSGIYGILHGEDGEPTLLSQEADGLYSGRSALWVQFPVTPDLWIPFAVHHNRYSGTRAIAEMKTGYVKAENIVRARLVTVEDEADFLARKSSPPLIVGDFNVPAAYVQMESSKRKTKAWERRAELRESHVRKMGCAGYLRRRRVDGTHPETTMKRGFTIAKGDGLFSEPYDAVYQPFDFLGGAATVQSAAVRNVHAFFRRELLDETVTYASPSGSTSTTVQEVLAEQVSATYRGIVTCICSTLRDAEGWLVDKLESRVPGRLAGNGLLTVKRQMWTRYSSFHEAVRGSVTESINWGVDDLNALRAAINHVKPFVESEIKKRKGSKKSKRTEEEDDLEDEASTGGPSTSTAKRKRSDKPAEERLMDLPELIDGLTNLEKNVQLRLWAAYGSIVSDHLPVLVEVDLGPGS